MRDAIFISGLRRHLFANHSRKRFFGVENLYFLRDVAGTRGRRQKLWGISSTTGCINSCSGCATSSISAILEPDSAGAAAQASSVLRRKLAAGAATPHCAEPRRRPRTAAEEGAKAETSGAHATTAHAPKIQVRETIVSVGGPGEIVCHNLLSQVDFRCKVYGVIKTKQARAPSRRSVRWQTTGTCFPVRPEERSHQSHQ
jgi:hypothetical protein